MNIIIKEIKISQELRDMVDYWHDWNIPPVAGIKEGAGDGAAREMARRIRAELEKMNRLLKLINKEAHGVEP